MANLTEAQRCALEFLRDRSIPAAPSEIGEALRSRPGDRRKHGKGAGQGLGRTGGAMAHRLIKAGYVADASRERGGFPAYRITAAGRAALI